MSTARKSTLTVAEYLAHERRAPQRSEYLAGEVFALVGASRNHNLITTNVGSELRRQLKSGSCEVYCSDMRVGVDETGLYTYPDVVVVCDDPRFEDDQLDTLLNPVVLVEVLSETTEAYDRGRKFAHYRQIESMQDYILIAQDQRLIERFSRQSDGNWILSDADASAVTIESIGCALDFDEVYDKVVFEQATE